MNNVSQHDGKGYEPKVNKQHKHCEYPINADTKKPPSGKGGLLHVFFIVYTVCKHYQDTRQIYNKPKPVTGNITAI